MEDRLNQPITRVDTPHDRSSDTPHYEALEQARGGTRRQPRRRAPASSPAPTSRPSPAAASVPTPRDGIRGTRLDVVA